MSATAIGHRVSDGTYFLRLIKVVAPGGRELICYGPSPSPYGSMMRMGRS